MDFAPLLSALSGASTLPLIINMAVPAAVAIFPASIFVRIPPRDRIEAAKNDWKQARFDIVPGDDKEFIPLPDA